MNVFVLNSYDKTHTQFIFMRFLTNSANLEINSITCKNYSDKQFNSTISKFVDTNCMPVEQNNLTHEMSDTFTH